MGTVFYMGQEDVDFSNTAYGSGNPVIIATDGVRARTGSSPYVIGSYNANDVTPLTIDIGLYYGQFTTNTNNLNEMWFTCRYYVDGPVLSPGTVDYNTYMFSFQTFENHYIIFYPTGGVYFFDGITTPVLIASSPAFVANTLTKVDIHIVYGTTGTIQIWKNGSNVLNYQGDTTNGNGAGNGFYQIFLGSGGDSGSNVPTYFSEIICTDTIHTINLYMGYTAIPSVPGFVVEQANYTSNVVSTTNYDVLFSYNFTVTNPPYYKTNDVIYGGQSSSSTTADYSEISTQGQFFTWFSIIGHGGADATYSYKDYDGATIAALTYVPCSSSSITGINLLTAAADDPNRFNVTTGPAGFTFGIQKLLMHFVYGAPLLTNIMVLA